jgi:tetratricopeptide (TPR) repeat protein
MDRAGLQVWSQSFDRKLESIFIIQSEIASAVTSQIVAEIVSSGGQSALRATYNMDAYNEYLVGRALTHARGPAWDIKSEAAFRRAVELDPDFAPAHAGLAYSLIIMATPTQERIDAALAAAQRALDLDPNLALGHAILGVMQTGLGLTSPAEAEQRLRRALELDPALSDAYNWLSINLRVQGRQAEADVVTEQGYQIDPLHPSIAGNYANLRANHGDFDRAMRILEPFTRLPQMGGAVWAGLRTINADYGRYAEAIKVNAGPVSAPYWEALGFHERADELVAQIQDPYRQVLVQHEVHNCRGEHQQAWTIIEGYLDENQYLFEELEPDDQAWALSAQALGGDYEGAIEHFEAIGDGDPLAWLEDVNGLGVADFLNAMGFAYLETGDTHSATRVLSFEPKRLAHFKPYSSPIILAPMALNAALLGDDDLAYQRLSMAVEKGWADYYRAINDPRWGDVLSQARFVRLMEAVKADIDEQRAKAEAILRDND